MTMEQTTYRLSSQVEMMVGRHLNSIQTAEDCGNVLSSMVLQSLASESDESLWSSKRLRKEIKSKDLKTLFKKYTGRIYHSVFVMFLLCCSLYSITHIVKAAITGSKPSWTTRYVPLMCVIVDLCFLILSHYEGLFRRHPSLAFISSAVVFLFLATQEYGAYAIECVTHELCTIPPKQPRLGSFFYLTLLIYFLPPFRQKYQLVVVGMIIIVLEICMSLLMVQVPIQKMIPEFICFVVLNTLGLMKLYVNELSQRRSFIDHRDWVKLTLDVKFQKEQEEKLMLSFIPKYLCASLKPVIREALEKTKERMEQSARYASPFHDLYVCMQKDVSILFADIVNFTPLTETMEVGMLVEMLNQLFGRFDEAAEKNNCLRIKILGDCYYCVCGIPDPRPDHAQSCVIMGFDMIDIIRGIREQRNLNIDMRIGINSGNVLCGLIGIRKWQYDIWSKDVTIANLMEQSGKPGKVHISKATRDLLGDTFSYENGMGHLRNATVQQWHIQTFFVNFQQFTVKDEVTVGERRFSAKPQKLRRNSAPVLRLSGIRKTASDNSLHIKRKTALDQSLIHTNLVSQVNSYMDKAIDSLALSKREQWSMKSPEINPCFLTFKLCRLESPYLKQRDPLFKYNLLGAVYVFVTILLIANLEFSFQLFYYCLHSMSAVFLSFFCSIVYLSWHNFIRKRLKGVILESTPHYALKGVWKHLIVLSNDIQSKLLLQLIIWISFGLSLLAWVSLAGWDAIIGSHHGHKNEVMNITYGNESTAQLHNKLSCSLETAHNVEPRFITYCFALSMVATASFTRIHYLLKLVMNILIFSAFLVMADTVWSYHCLLWTTHFLYDSKFHEAAHMEHTIFLLNILFLLHLENRQVEYLSRLDYLWKCKLESEKNEIAQMKLVNRTLLLNILPFHVAERYFINSVPHDQLYHEKYEEIAVMFASISNFMDFYTENEFNLNGKSCLKVLNEVILQFDELLSEPRFSRIEKMKVVSSTYMAAAGLQPGMRSRAREVGCRPLDAATNLEMLTNFAIAMMEKLVNMNKEALQDFQLRIGIDCGPIIAGIIGTHKPFYDIWGNTVNVASRLESTGEMEKIQVTAKTAAILTQKGFECECRGEIFVKGKGNLVTYFVKTQFDPEATQL